MKTSQLLTTKDISDHAQGVRAQDGTFPDEIWPSPRNSPEGPLTVGDVRQAAYHRHEYSTRLILCAVCLLIQLGDNARLTKLQSVLRMLYQERCLVENKDLGYEPLSDDEISEAKDSLDIDSRVCTSQQQMLSEIQSILERSFFRFASAHNPAYFQQLNIIESERIELDHWSRFHSWILTDSIAPNRREKFPRKLEAVCDLRNAASHPSFNPAFDREWVDKAIDILEKWDERGVIAELNSLADRTKDLVESATQARLDSYPTDAAGLWKLYNECHTAGTKYSQAIATLKSPVTQHHMRICGIFDNAERSFRDMYEQTLKAESGTGDTEQALQTDTKNDDTEQPSQPATETGNTDQQETGNDAIKQDPKTETQTGNPETEPSASSTFNPPTIIITEDTSSVPEAEGSVAEKD